MKQGIRQFFRNMPLKGKLILAFVSLVMLPVMTFSGFVLISQQRHMTERVNSYFADSVTQMALRVDHMMDEYENALATLSMNRQIMAVFDEKNPTYYQQYDAMHNTLEPMLMMVGQFLPAYRSMGIYTDNTAWRERGSTFIFVDRLYNKPWYNELTSHRGYFWTRDDDVLVGFLRMLRSSLRAPVRYAYITIDPATLVASGGAPLTPHSLYLLDGEKLLYSEHTGDYVLDIDDNPDGFRVKNGEEYILVRRTIETTGWTLCLCCPYDGLYAVTTDTLQPLMWLAVSNLLFLAVIGTLIAGSLSSRMNRLSESIKKAATGDLVQQIETSDRDEIGVLTNHFADMLKSLRDHIRINYENTLLLRESELRALQAQINPHFLYNSLSVINWMALGRDADDISDVVCNLSNFYRSVLNHGSPTLTVADELDNIRAYLNIQLRMHANSFTADIDIDESIMDKHMIGIILQPIVENAIEHGIDLRTESTGAYLRISGRAEPDGLVFRVSDNGPGMSREQFNLSVSRSSKTYGLKNVQDRLRIAYGDEYGLFMDDTAEEGTVIIIKIPDSSEI